MLNLPFNWIGLRPAEAGGAKGEPARQRLLVVDAARGLAVVAMVVYHFSWDLRYFGYIAADVEGALGWRLFARAIAGTFLFIVGVSLVLAERRGFDPKRFLRRLAIVAAGAAAVTVVTWFTFRDTYVFFGILHNIALSSLLGLLFVRAPLPLTLGAAVLAFAAPALLASPAFDRPWLLWIGLSTTTPRSNDFVPVLPWFGVVLLGVSLARVTHEHGLERRFDAGRIPGWLLFVGRHSLIIYLLHQPILFGLVDLAARVYPPDFLGFEPSYVESCMAACAEQDVEAEICNSTCACAAERTQGAGLWAGMMRQSLSIEEEMRYFALVDRCRLDAESGN
jgi:uncharacterized membrane protein